MKKIHGLFLSLACLAGVLGTSTACEEQYTAKEIAQTLVYSGLDSLNVDFKLYNELDGAKITYSVDEGNQYLSFNKDYTMCYVNPPLMDDTDTAVQTKFYAHVTKDGETVDKTFKCKLQPAGFTTTVAAMAADFDPDGSLDLGHTTYRVRGLYVGSSGVGALIYDGTGFIYSYGTTTLDVGTQVIVDGSVTKYNGILEFSKPTYGVWVTDNPVTLPEDERVIDVKTADKIVAWAGAASMLRYTGTKIRATGKIVTSGKYTNFEVDGADATKGILRLNCDNNMSTLATNFNSATYTGNVVVEGYTLYYGGNGTAKVMQILPTSITAA